MSVCKTRGIQKISVCHGQPCNFVLQRWYRDWVPHFFNSSTFWTKLTSLVSGVKQRKMAEIMIADPKMAGGRPFIFVVVLR